jgi:hypothetical protein
MKIKGSRANLMPNRSGTWTLAYTEILEASLSRDTGYRQMRGQRDELVAHAKEIGVTTIAVVGLLGARAIEDVQVYFSLRDLDVVSSALHLPKQEQL